jgi:hypothetical protein
MLVTKAKAKAKASGGPAKWEINSAKFRSNNAIPAHYKPWTLSSDKHKCLGLPSCCVRQLDILDVAWTLRLKQYSTSGVSSTKAALAKGFFANVSQDVSRRAWGRPKTLCRGTVLYSFQGDFTLTGGDHMAAMGCPTDLSYCSELSDREKRDLAGEAFAVPSVCSMIAGVFMNRFAHWWRHQM